MLPAFLGVVAFAVYRRRSERPLLDRGAAGRRGPRSAARHRHPVAGRPARPPARAPLGPPPGWPTRRARHACLPGGRHRARLPPPPLPARHGARRLLRTRPGARRGAADRSAPTSPSPDRWYPPDERARGRPEPRTRPRTRPRSPVAYARRDHRDGDRAGAAARCAPGGAPAARAARRRRAARRADRDGRPARGLRHPAPDDPRRAAARGRRRLDRRRQVDAGQLPRRHPCHRARRAAPHDALAGPGAPPRRRAVVRPGPPAARARAGRPARPTTPPRCSSSRHRAMAPGLAILDAPDIDSVEEQQPRAGGRSCSPPPTCGSSSPRRPATPTRCRGTSSARPPTAPPRSRSSSTARRPTRSTPSPPTWPGCSPVAGSRTPRSSSSRRAGSVRDGPAALVVGHRDPAAGCGAGRDQDARPSVVQQTLDGAIRTLARRTHSVADAATEQVDAVRRLREDANGPTTGP